MKSRQEAKGLDLLFVGLAPVVPLEPWHVVQTHLLGCVPNAASQHTVPEVVLPPLRFDVQARGSQVSVKCERSLRARKARQKRLFVASSSRAGFRAGRERPAVPFVQENQAPASASEKEL